MRTPDRFYVLPAHRLAMQGERLKEKPRGMPRPHLVTTEHGQDYVLWCSEETAMEVAREYHVFIRVLLRRMGA